ncbi:MAG: DUF1761 domain-containing protein [Bdellovibrionales bacterium]|nr:DUF1761 domain-containing protein [Bdellovibrionales bacterium]
MIEAISQINILAVLAAMVPNFILGGVWFGIVVSKLYIKALGRDALPQTKPSPIFIFGPVVCNLFAILTSAILLRMLQIESIPGALAFGLLVGVGYLLSTVMNIAINPNFPRPFLYTFINAPYFIASSLITSVVLVSMG